jgi:hypothetical protein
LSQFSNSWSPTSSITPKEYPWRSMWRWSLAYWELLLHHMFNVPHCKNPPNVFVL